MLNFHNLNLMVGNIDNMLFGLNIKPLIDDLFLYKLFNNIDCLDWKDLSSKVYFHILNLMICHFIFNLNFGVDNINRVWSIFFFDYHAVNVIVLSFFLNFDIAE
jgi:hypothetical protein